MKKNSNLMKILILIFAVSLVLFTFSLLKYLGVFDNSNSLTTIDSPTSTPANVNSNEDVVVSPTPSLTPTPTPIPEPTSTPTPASTPTPTPTPPPESNISCFNGSDASPYTPPSYKGSAAYLDYAKVKTFDNGKNIKFWTFENNTPIVDYVPDYSISFGSAKEYTDVEGITTFRGNNYRNSASYGSADVTQKKLSIEWTYDIGEITNSISYWPGVGWTGQPMIVHWPEETRKLMNINDEMKNKDLTEVIYATLDGNIYFLDLETGKPTREKFVVGFPIKGTAMLDPRGYPLYYTGMGINLNGSKSTSFKYRIINLIDQKEIYSIAGTDPVCFRNWGAFDSSALFDRNTDTLIECAENGLLYKVKLNTNFDKQAGTISLNPEVSKYRYKGVYNDLIGIENSPVIYKNMIYFADNGGLLQCVDINTFEPKWIYNLEDDTDSTIVLDETSDGVFIYIANEVDFRCSSTGSSNANSSIRKFNALTGELIWQKDYNCLFDSVINGGVLSTPVIGKDDISDLVIYNIAKKNTLYDGKMVALDKKTGEEVWTRDLKYYSWSSPVDFKGTDGKTYMIFCDFYGDMHLMDPRTGDILDTISVGKNVEGSPAIYGDTIVVGSYAKKIYGVKIR